MKNKWIVLLVIFMFLMSVIAGCGGTAANDKAQDQSKQEQTKAEEKASVKDSSGEKKEAEKKQYYIGYIAPGPDVYYQYEVEGAKYVVEKNGHKFSVLNSENKPEKEISNIEDFIAKKVDAIILFTTNADTAQKAAQKCNEAKIPLFLNDCDLADGSGKAQGQVTVDMKHSGELIGEYVVKNYPNAKVAIIEGLAGQALGNPYTEGFKAKTKDTTTIKMVANQPADWNRLKAMSVMQNLLTAHPDIDLVFVQNEDMAKGVAQVIKDANKAGKITILSQNGSPTGEEMLKSGELKATSAWSPSKNGKLVAQKTLDFLDGKNPEYLTMAPMKVITKENLSELEPWPVKKD